MNDTTYKYFAILNGEKNSSNNYWKWKKLL